MNWNWQAVNDVNIKSRTRVLCNIQKERKIVSLVPTTSRIYPGAGRGTRTAKEKTITRRSLLHLVKQEIHHKGTPAIHATVQVEKEEGWGDGVHGYAGTIQQPVPHRHHVQVLTNNRLTLEAEAPLLRSVAQSHSCRCSGTPSLALV